MLLSNTFTMKQTALSMWKDAPSSSKPTSNTYV